MKSSKCKDYSGDLKLLFLALKNIDIDTYNFKPYTSCIILSTDKLENRNTFLNHTPAF